MLSLWPGFGLCCCFSALLSCQKIRRQKGSHVRVAQKIMKLQQNGAVSSSLITHTHHPIQSLTIVLMTVQCESVFVLVSCRNWIVLQGQIKLSVSVSPQIFLNVTVFAVILLFVWFMTLNVLMPTYRRPTLPAHPHVWTKRFGCCNVDSSEVKFGAIHFGPDIAKEKWKFSLPWWGIIVCKCAKRCIWSAMTFSPPFIYMNVKVEYVWVLKCSFRSKTLIIFQKAPSAVLSTCKPLGILNVLGIMLEIHQRWWNIPETITVHYILWGKMRFPRTLHLSCNSGNLAASPSRCVQGEHVSSLFTTYYCFKVQPPCSHGWPGVYRTLCGTRCVWEQ